MNAYVHRAYSPLVFLYVHVRIMPLQSGQIVVFNIKNREIPIVHRILKVHEQADGSVSMLTKGDNNQVHDRGLYSDGQMWLEREDIVGKAVGSLRYIGMVTIWLNDYPSLKYLLVRTTTKTTTACSTTVCTPTIHPCVHVHPRMPIDHAVGVACIGVLC